MTSVQLTDATAATGHVGAPAPSTPQTYCARCPRVFNGTRSASSIQHPVPDSDGSRKGVPPANLEDRSNSRKPNLHKCSAQHQYSGRQVSQFAGRLVGIHKQRCAYKGTRLPVALAIRWIRRASQDYWSIQSFQKMAFINTTPYLAIQIVSDWGQVDLLLPTDARQLVNLLTAYQSFAIISPLSHLNW
jgi:hypothetical protein